MSAITAIVRNEEWLTPRQREIWQAIRTYMREYKSAPTIREIQDLCGIASPSTVLYNLRVLQRKHFIGFAPGITRSIQLIEYPGDPCPFCGCKGGH